MVLDIPTLHVLTVLALIGTGTSIWAIAVGREEMVYHLSIIPVAFLVYCLDDPQRAGRRGCLRDGAE
jgi:hypothetical protein